MEEEIDALFLGQKGSEIQESSIKELEDCAAGLSGLDPYIDVIKKKMGTIRMDYDLYYIKLERLAKEMESIEEENTKLENEILYQTSIYNRLRDLLISLEIKEEHFISLETDPLDSPEGISRIEKALNILSNFDIKDYTIRVVNEKKERVDTALRLFYKRFIHFLGKFFVGGESVGELQVHKQLYTRMKAFKDIYAYSRRFQDFYVVLCKIYIKHAKNLYDREMENHLSAIQRLLASDPTKDKVEKALSSLLEGYRSIIGCEINFLKSLSIDSDGFEIFEDTNKAISVFVQEIYYVSDLVTINYLDLNWHKVPPEEKVYYSLQEDLKVLVGRLKKKFIGKELEIRNKEVGVERFKKYLKQSQLKDLNGILYSLNRDRILRNSDQDIFETIESIRLIKELYSEDSSREEYLESLGLLDETFKKLLIGFVLEDGDSKVEENLREIISKIKGDEKFKKEMHKQMYDILKEVVQDKEDLECLA